MAQAALLNIRGVQLHTQRQQTQSTSTRLPPLIGSTRLTPHTHSYANPPRTLQVPKPSQMLKARIPTASHFHPALLGGTQCGTANDGLSAMANLSLQPAQGFSLNDVDLGTYNVFDPPSSPVMDFSKFLGNPSVCFLELVVTLY